MLIISLSTALISFIAFGTFSYLNMNKVYDKAISTDQNIVNSTAESTEMLTVDQAQKHLLSIAFEKSRCMERGMNDVKADAESIALQINQILAEPDKYKEISIPYHKDKPIKSGEAYIHFAPEVLRNGITSELKHEIGICSNIADMLKVISSFYLGHQTSSYIGSKNGYLICIDTLPNKDGTINFTEDFINNYDPRERPWYKAAKEAQKTKITDFYTGADGYLAVTFATPYYDKDGFAGVAAVGASLESLYKQITEDSNGIANINFALSDKGEVVLSSTATGTFAVSRERGDLRKSSENSLAEAITNMVSGKSEVSLVTVDGKRYYLAYAPMKSIGWSFGTLIERDEVIQPANSIKNKVLTQTDEFKSSMKSFYMQHMRNILISLVVILVLLFGINVIESKRFVKPILTLTKGVKEIAKGDLDKKLEIKTGDEIEDLADSVNNMTSELKNYMENLSKVTAEKERIATELSVARNIQAAMLPNVNPDFSNKVEFDLAATMNPARGVGGDFYDFYKLDENHLAITIADVSGKGIGAALFMVISKTELKNFALTASVAYSEGREPDLAAIIQQTNQQLLENNDEYLFVTVFFGVLDLRTGELAYVNAGHNPPLMHRKNENEFSFIRNEKRNCAVGISKKVKYIEYRLTLSPGDCLFLYTDGITEAMNKQRELFGEKRLKAALDSIKVENKANDMLSTVFDSVKQHVGDAEQSDDMTMLGLVYNQKKAEV